MFENLWRKWMSRGKSARSSKPRVELLEDRCLPATTIAQFPVSAGSAPGGITSGPDGNVWFTESQASQIGMINPTTHAAAEFPVTTAGSAPTGIAAGPDGNLWFTESAANKIGMINPTTHAVTEFAIPTAGSQPTAITAGPDGNLWFTERSAGQIGAINPTSHTITEFGLPTSGSAPAGIAAGPDGNLWFTEYAGNKIASINPVTQAIAEYGVPKASSQPYGIVAGADGNLWFVENNSSRIAQINPTSHLVTEYGIPTGASGPIGITAAGDGNLWFTEYSVNKIGTMYLSNHVITEMGIPTAASGATGISAGPGGTLWFAESAAGQIGEVVASPMVSATPINATVIAGQTATFFAAASVGFPAPTVLWQVSTDNGLTFTPLTNAGVYSGVNTGTLTITGATTAMTGYRYEAVFTNGVSPGAISAPATLTVNSVLSIMPTFPQGTPGVAYNQTVSVVGSISPFTLFSVNNFSAGGTGLTFANISTNSVNGTITVNGNPTAVGTATFTVAVANAAGNTLTQTVSITISPPLAIATPALPGATAGVPYSQAINVIGGAQPYTTFSVTNFNGGTTGLIPAAITAFAPLGVFSINAIPPAGGTATFTVNVTDSAGTALSKSYTITVNPPLVITPALPQGTAGANYQQTVAVTGGGVPYTTFTVTNFNAGTTGLTRANLTVNAPAGTIAINGTPTAAGIFSFNVNVVDALGAALTKTFAVTINPALAITPSLPQGTAGVSYHQIIAVAGGTTPFTTFSVTGFNGGATGLIAAFIVPSAATGTFALQGTPIAAGTASFTVNIVDAAGGALIRTYSIAINPAPTVGNLTTTQWTAGLPGFTGVLTAAGGAGTLTLAGYLGLPTGLTATLTGNTIGFVGTPSIAGTFAGSVTIHDAVGASVTKPISITIIPAPTVGALSAAQWTVGRPGFNGIMAAAGGTGGLTLAGSSGLPTGMSILLIGNTLSFTGTPTAAGTFAGGVTLKDALGAAVTTTFSLTINAAPTLGNLNVTQWTVGKTGFNGSMAIAAGTGPYTIVSSTGLPTGLTAVVNCSSIGALGALATGASISFIGTPSVAQTFAAGTITLRDAAGATVTRTFSITINPPVLIITTSFLPSAQAILYSATVYATGGTGAVTFALTAGSLPPGMRISSTGVIAGATRGFGAFTFTITATDAIGASMSKVYTILIARHA